MALLHGVAAVVGFAGDRGSEQLRADDVHADVLSGDPLLQLDEAAHGVGQPVEISRRRHPTEPAPDGVDRLDDDVAPL